MCVKKLLLIVKVAVIVLIAVLAVKHALAIEDKLLGDDVESAGQALSYVVQTGAQSAEESVSNGESEYSLNQNLSTLLIIGIDKSGPVQASQSYNNNEQADFLMLIIADKEKKTYSLLQLNRDTMTDVRVLGLNGQSAGYYTEQLALAHTYGSGMNDSCENTADAVSLFLYNIKIDNYISMKMDAVVKLNDYAGGVTLTIPDDFEAKGELIPGKTVTLNGDNALFFIRSRDNTSNVARMGHQRQYIEAFIAALKTRNGKLDSEFLDVYGEISDYIVTDLKINEMAELITTISDYEYLGVNYPEGEAVKGDEYIEFYPDEEKLQQLVLDLFYIKSQTNETDALNKIE